MFHLGVSALLFYVLDRDEFGSEEVGNALV